MATISMKSVRFYETSIITCHFFSLSLRMPRQSAILQEVVHRTNQ
jgi:hypothetical protein